MINVKVINPIPCFSSHQIEAICRSIADTYSGLTGSEIGHILEQSHIPDVDPLLTKWKRLFNAFIVEQNKKQYGNHIISFLHNSLNPAKYVNNKSFFETKRIEINKVLAFSGLMMREDGKIAKTKPVTTISEAELRASNLRDKLKDRSVHPDVLEFCKAELLDDNYFHAVLEASKSVANKVRKMSELTSDGAELVQDAFSLGKDCKPILAINNLYTDTEKGEQRGFVNLLLGLFGTFRNPVAHAEKIFWEMNEDDALDILSLISLIHRKLDKAKKIN